MKDLADSYYCTRCKEDFTDPDLMCWVKGKVRKRCKSCHTKEEKHRRDKKTKDELKELSRKYYKNRKVFLSNIDESSEEGLAAAIHKWVNTATARNSEDRFKERKGLNKIKLKELCLKAKEMFPYITFNNIREGSTHSAFWASLDKIDSSKPYTDDNIVVVPLWLNSAKLDFSYEELFTVFDMLDKEKFILFIGK